MVRTTFYAVGRERSKRKKRSHSLESASYRSVMNSPLVLRFDGRRVESLFLCGEFVDKGYRGVPGIGRVEANRGNRGQSDLKRHQ